MKRGGKSVVSVRTFSSLATTYLHEDQDPHLAVRHCLLETGNSTLGRLNPNSVAIHTVLSKLSLLGSEPSSVKRVIGEHEHGKKSHEKCHNALHMSARFWGRATRRANSPQ